MDSNSAECKGADIWEGSWFLIELQYQFRHVDLETANVLTECSTTTVITSYNSSKIFKMFLYDDVDTIVNG